MDTKKDILSVQGMLPFLTQKEGAERIFVHQTLESTNITARELVMKGAEHGTVVIADSQTGGKGRYGRSFFSPPGHGIYMSIALRQTAAWLETSDLITPYTAVAVCEAIEAICKKHPKIKWVNDIFLDEKKICGILSQTIEGFGGVRWVIIGIGINFSTPESGFPEDLKEIAAAIYNGDMPHVTRNRLASEVLNRLTAMESRFDARHLLDEYRKRLNMLGKQVTVTGAGESFRAKAIDIDDMGHLVLLKNSGKTLLLSTGEISIKI